MLGSGSPMCQFMDARRCAIPTPTLAGALVH